MNPPRQPKSLRLGHEELTLLQTLLPALPHYSAEAELLAEAARRGLLIMAAEALVSGADVPGHNARILAQRLRTALLPALELLVAQGALPAMLGAIQTQQPVEPPPPAPVAPPAISATVASDLSSFGSAFLNDDDDED